MSNLSNNPVETVEANVAVRVLRYALRTDSGGAGRWRGGSGLELEFEALTDGSLLARGLERLRFRPWGFAGGAPGALTELVVNEGRANERRLSVVDVHPLRAGDRVVLRTSGAGGYGDPLRRDPHAVLDDVAAGLVSTGQALEAYGVVVRDGALDEAATTAERAGTAGPDRTEGPPTHALGPEREHWERVFPGALADRLDRHLRTLPTTVRAARRREILGGVLAGLPARFPGTPATDAALDAAARAFADAVSGLDAPEPMVAAAAGPGVTPPA
nr:hydantoinase B/oxoprolinase family protein [Cellulosimicrobium sp. CUA-896]